MLTRLRRFETIARRASQFTEAAPQSEVAHPFDVRDVHPDFPADVRRLFDNGHFAQATFEAFKFLDEEVQRISGSSDFGKDLMMKVFSDGRGTPPAPPLLRLNMLATRTEVSEQEGFKFLFAGSTMAIRNPRGHKTGVVDDPDICLDHLSLASLLLRRLDDAGLR